MDVAKSNDAQHVQRSRLFICEGKCSVLTPPSSYPLTLVIRQGLMARPDAAQNAVGYIQLQYPERTFGLPSRSYVSLCFGHDPWRISVRRR